MLWSIRVAKDGMVMVCAGLSAVLSLLRWIISGYFGTGIGKAPEIDCSEIMGP